MRFVLYGTEDVMVSGSSFPIFSKLLGDLFI